MTAGQQNAWITVAALGVTQIFAWGATYYLLAILAEPIAADTGWQMAWVIGGLSLGLLVAGLVSPSTGRAIERHSGRPVLAASSVLIGLGLIALASAPNLLAYAASWIVLGVGMGTGLYDAAFATLGRAYGGRARSTITALTLIGGFSSTVCWPFSAVLVENYGWRATCVVYAAIHLSWSLAAHLSLIPRATEPTADAATAAQPDLSGRREASERELYVLALALTLITVISAIMSVQMILILEARGLDIAAAVGLAALLGPSQVGARLVEMLFGRHYHPIWTLILATALIATGLAFLLLGLPPLLAVTLYGGGIGIAWIARGTVPLVIFGQRNYAVRMGRLAFPSLIAQALSPSVGAILLVTYGVDTTLAALLSAALLALIASVWLRRVA